MLVDGINYQSIWVDEKDPSVVSVIDQQKLPFIFEIKKLRSVDDICDAIRDMTVRGAPLIGAAGAFGVYLAAMDSARYNDPLPHIEDAAKHLISCRPTAVNLAWAVNYTMDNIRAEGKSMPENALKTANEICDIEKENCRRIGNYGLSLIKAVSNKKKGAAVNILTHCNAGWLACIDFGTVLSCVYFAHDAGIPVHVWVDETRPRNQGARLTAWELENASVPYTLITDNAGGHLMQHGMVDLVIVGCDRATRSGAVANKIGTYLKALAAHDNKIPFYSAFPSSSFDFKISNGIREIPVEERGPEEVTMVSGISDGNMTSVRICPENCTAVNFGFDVTPAKYITGLITERGICRPLEKEIKRMFSDKFI
ncbi:MAG: S-methyl-5-thioribose-1-phosphate isomerase [Bacteroidales bacterium]